MAKIKASKATMPRFSSPNRAAASKSPVRVVKSKNLGNGAIKVFDEKQEEKRDSSVDSYTPTGEYGAYYNAAKNLRQPPTPVEKPKTQLEKEIEKGLIS